MPRVSQPEDFAPLIGQQFHFINQNISLRLASVEVAGASPGAAERLALTLVFRGPPGELLPEGLHRAVTRSGAAYNLYIMPIHTTRRDHQAYQAVFN